MRQTPDGQSPDSPALRRLTVSTPQGAQQNDVVALMHQVADALVAAGPLEVADITFHVDATEHGPWPSVTVYYEPIAVIDEQPEPLGEIAGDSTAANDDDITDDDDDIDIDIDIDIYDREPIVPRSQDADSRTDEILPLTAALAFGQPLQNVKPVGATSAFARLKRVLRSQPRRDGHGEGLF